MGRGRYRLFEKILRTTVLISLNRGHLAGSPAPNTRGVYQTSPWYIYLSGTPAVSPNPFPWVASQARQVRGTTAGLNKTVVYVLSGTPAVSPNPFRFLRGHPCCFRGIVGQRREPLHNDADKCDRFCFGEGVVCSPEPPPHRFSEVIWGEE